MSDQIFETSSNWYFWDETGAYSIGPFAAKAIAWRAMIEYARRELNGDPPSYPVGSYVLHVPTSRIGRVVYVPPSGNTDSLERITVAFDALVTHLTSEHCLLVDLRHTTPLDLLASV